MWIAGDAAGSISVQSEEVHSGSKAAVIENLEPNHLKWVQTVTVVPDSYYRISGYVKIASIAGGGIGANIFPVGIGGGYPATSDTGGEWQRLEFIGQTGKEQTEIGIGAALGGYANLVQGKAYFDDLSVEKLDTVPEGSNIISLDSGAQAPRQMRMEEASRRKCRIRYLRPSCCCSLELSACSLLFYTQEPSAVSVC